MLWLPGCAAFHPLRGVPASYLPDQYEGERRAGKKTINLSLLVRRPPDQYRVDSGDVLAIYIPGVLGKISTGVEEAGEEPPKPWHAGAYTLTAREFDMILVWANGGTPRGDAAKAPPVMSVKTQWASGAPDATLKMPAPFTLSGPTNEATHDVVLPVGAAAGKSLRAVDLLPGQPAIVRMATLALKSADGTVRPLGSWIPGQAHAIALKAHGDAAPRTP